MKALQYFPEVPSQLQALPPLARREVKAALEKLRLPKATRELDCKRLLGTFAKPVRRLKVGSWRVAFYEDGNNLFVIRVFPRSQGYDWLDDWTVP